MLDGTGRRPSILLDNEASKLPHTSMGDRWGGIVGTKGDEEKMLVNSEGTNYGEAKKWENSWHRRRWSKQMT